MSFSNGIGRGSLCRRNSLCLLCLDLWVLEQYFTPLKWVDGGDGGQIRTGETGQVVGNGCVG